MSRYTVLGSSGFIGASLVRTLRAQGRDVVGVAREELPALQGSLGHVIYAIGLTADFRHQPIETLEAHVGLLADLFQRGTFDSFLYLSSTRIYSGAPKATESASVSVSPLNPDHLYNISKIAGEALCLSQSHRGCRIARLSNVVGVSDRSGNFLSSVLDEAAKTGKVVFRTSPDSARDFIAVEDVCGLLVSIAEKGKERIYNVASGTNVTNEQIGKSLERLIGIRFSYEMEAPKVAYPLIEVDRIKNEFDFAPTVFDEVLERLLVFPANEKIV